MILPDHGSRQWASFQWNTLSLFGPLFHRLVWTVKYAGPWLLRHLQSLKLYRFLAKQLVGSRTRYKVATEADALDLSRLYLCRFPELGDPVKVFAGSIDSLNGCGYTLIARVGKEMAGATIIRCFPENPTIYPDWWLFSMLVRTRYRGASIAEGLLRMSLSKAAEQGATCVNLLVSEQNKVAISLYRKMRFQQVSIPGLDAQLTLVCRKVSKPRVGVEFVIVYINPSTDLSLCLP